MSEVTIRSALKEDAEVIFAMLKRLADEMGDSEIFSSTVDTIRMHGFSDHPLFYVLLAECEKTTIGFALYFVHYSTTRGSAGVYVQDLWVASEARNLKIGAKLLKEIAIEAHRKWGSSYLKLTVHNHNVDARRFYKKVCFSENENETALTLEADKFTKLRGLT